MQDGIIKGTGNSRFLKSITGVGSMYPTYESFIAALEAGTFPIDLNGLNPGGWMQQGTNLTKENLLKDATAALYGLDSTAVPDDILSILFERVSTSNINHLVIEKITASRDWTAPKAALQLFKVMAVGGGGGGGHGGSHNNNNESGGGGGGGYISIGTFTIPKNTVVPTVCGAGGAAGKSQSGIGDWLDGKQGGTTSFGAYLNAPGGDGGVGGYGRGSTGGDGGAGGGSDDGTGGNGGMYGGGGGSISGTGGNGGTYGGGGYGAIAGKGGSYGGDGGVIGVSGGSAGAPFRDPLLNVMLSISNIRDFNSSGGGGGGGYGGKGGGGGGGYCGNGGSGSNGGGGGYCGNGGSGGTGDSSGNGGGGGGGLFADGGNGGVGGGGGGGITNGGNASSTAGGVGGDGGVYIIYIRED